MSTDRMLQVQQLFTAVCDLEPAARVQWLDDSDVSTDLRFEVASLLRYHDLGEAEGFLAINATPPVTDALLGQRIGPYEIVALLGSGGMGSVYRAVRVADYRQEVAVKVTALLSPEALTRFEAERQVLADLVHPRIARLLDGGVLPDGRPYLVMEYIPGQRLDQYAESKQLSLIDRSKLLVDICGAMTYAHERGVIHRDLKPGNLLVTDDGMAHVVDFGLARRLDTAVDQTRSAALLGTPDYMAPEQAAGHAKAATPATDVYALGAVLYMLLTGRPPFRSEAPLLTLQRIREEEPLPPSRLNPAVPRDLETVCLKCLEKEPSLRYPTAQALAADLERFLDGEPVQARRISRMARVWRWARRHPLPATLAALLLFITVGGLVVVTTLWQLAVARSEQAERRQAQALSALKLYTDAAYKRLSLPLPVSPEERKALLKALADYESLLTDTGNDPATRTEAAMACMDLSTIFGFLKEHRLEEAAARRAIALFRQLSTDFPSHRGHRFDLAKAHVHLGNALYYLGDAQGQWEALHRATDLTRILVAEVPQHFDFCHFHLDHLRTLGGLYANVGRLDEAEVYYRQGMALEEQLRLRHPNDPRLTKQYLKGAGGLADLALQRGNPQPYMEHLRQRIAQCERFCAEGQKDAALFIDLLQYWNLVGMLHKAGQQTEALQVLHAGLKTIAALQERFSAVPWFRQAHAQLILTQALLVGPADSAKVTALSRAVLADYERLVQMFPTHTEYAAFLVLCRAHAPSPAVRDVAGAVQLARERLAQEPASPTWQRMLGIALCRAGEWVEAERLLAATLTAPVDKGCPDANYANLFLAVARARLGQHAAARQDLQAVQAELHRLWYTDVFLEHLLAEAQAMLPPTSSP